ncbi:MAG: ATP-dependent chaperone ClpB [Sneathiellales bacterium]|nr:ATP-dependent chaperone ClpB [Sneathiellales bacterium]
MDFNNYTDRSRGFIQAAQSLALRENHQTLTPEHLLKILLDDQEGLASGLINKAGGNANVALSKTEAELAKLPKVTGSGSGQINLSSELARVFSGAEKLAEKSGDSFISAERLLLALTLETGSKSAKILKDVGITANSLNEAINDLRKGRTADSASAEGSYDALKKYARDLTEAAREGKLDPVIGRDEEIRRTVQVLSRRTKNNPVLIGEPGVGKTAIIEGLALRIVNGDVPESLRDKKLMSLDLGQLIAGAKFRGEFEERLKSVLSEVSALGGEIVLFIDELHTLVGAGAAEGSMDASNLLKPALARGELHCVGATTLDEYRKYIEKDAALARRFQSVFVSEPTVEDSISILRGLKEKYELHHGVQISDSALVAAATLSNRYITDRFLPDKAIDLMDEAASRRRMEVDSKPEEVDELDRKILQLKIEASALEKEDDKASQDRLEKLKTELLSLEGKSETLTEAWRAEKEKLNSAQQVKEKLEQAKNDLAIYQRQGDLQKAGELAYGVIPALEKELSEASEAENSSLVRESVKEQDIAGVVSRWTGIPVEKMLSGEREKLLDMENRLRGRVIGQDEALEAVSNAVRRARAGLQDQNRPIGSFLFLGPTGVGKTELTKALAEFLFDDEHALLRVDMSEYMEKHSVARLIGAPPGYVGYDQGGVVTEAVRRRPYQIILFDEVEKAHPDVFNILLQVLDDGRLTDGQGRTVDFKNTVIILTSNLGSEHLDGDADADDPLVQHQVMEVVRSAFRPEFLNRLDEQIIFHRLSRADMDAIVDIQIERLVQLLEDRQITLNLDEAAKTWLADKGFDPVYGARPLKRVIQRSLQNPLANLLLQGEISDGQSITVSAAEGGLMINGTLADAA